MHSVWFGEFMGTLVLILLGNGVNAGVTLRKSYAADAGWMVVTTGWALAVLCGVLVAQAFGSPGANLNPAITLSGAISIRREKKIRGKGKILVVCAGTSDIPVAEEAVAAVRVPR